MKKLLLICLTAFAFACGDNRQVNDDPETGANTEQTDDENKDGTVEPDTTDMESDTTSTDGARP